MNKTSWIDKEVKDLKKQGLYNEIKTISTPIGAHIKVNGKKVLNFSSNNYLGLANDKRLVKAAKKAMNKYGIGPAAVRSIAGTTVLHKKLEEKLTKFKETEASITVQTGFAANLAVVPALVGADDIIFSDELNHASIIDACRLSKAEVVRYEHLNPKDLESKISAYKGSGKKLIITDGVFSMDGDIAPLNKLYKVAKKFGALLMVDDAHGEGVLGKGGRGIVDHFGLSGKVDIEIGTMSKAFGVIGGTISGRREIIEWLSQRGRPFLFSSAMTIPDVAACIKSVEILESSDKLVAKLWDNANYFKKKMIDLGFDTGRTQTPIIPVMIGDAKLAKEFSKMLFEKGIFAGSITYPTVPQGKARIRVMISAAHSKTDLNTALYVFETVGKELGIIN